MSENANIRDAESESRRLPWRAPGDPTSPISMIALTLPFYALAIWVASQFPSDHTELMSLKFLALTLGTVLVDMAEIRYSKNAGVLLTPPFLVAGLLLFEPQDALVFVLLTNVISSPIGARSWLHSLIRTTTYPVGGIMMFLTVVAIQELTSIGSVALGSICIAAALASMIAYDYAVFPMGHVLGWPPQPGDANAGTSLLRRFWTDIRNPHNHYVLRDDLVRSTMEVPLALALVGVTTMLWWFPVALAIPFLVMSAVTRQNVNLTSSLVKANDKLTLANIQFAAAMVHALDARDSYTAGHSAAVATYAYDLACELGLSEAECNRVHLAGLLHDIGKIGVPGHVLNKEGPLDDEEFDLMKEHAAIGAAILSEVNAYADLVPVIRHHHERFDGRGYPDRIAGFEIPMLSRLLTVADTYSAMTTDRPYRTGLEPSIAIEEIRKGMGTQFDAEIAAAFLRILERSDSRYLSGKLEAFATEVAKHTVLSRIKKPDDLAA